MTLEGQPPEDYSQVAHLLLLEEREQFSELKERIKKAPMTGHLMGLIGRMGRRLKEGSPGSLEDPLEQALALIERWEQRGSCLWGARPRQVRLGGQGVIKQVPQQKEDQLLRRATTGRSWPRPEQE
jgi:hypothetical protein